MDKVYLRLVCEDHKKDLGMVAFDKDDEPFPHFIEVKGRQFERYLLAGEHVYARCVIYLIVDDFIYFGD